MSKKLVSLRSNFNNFKKKSVSEKIVFITAFLLLLAFCCFILFFFLLGFLVALKDGKKEWLNSILDFKVFALPETFTFSSFANSFSTFAKFGNYDGSFLEITWNSLWRTTSYTFLSVMSSAMVCYILVFYRSKLSKFIYNLGLFVAILPLYGSTAATYKLMKTFGFINNPANMIINITLFGSYFFYMYSYFKTMSWEYAEASFVDGAGHFRVFFQIMFPMALPSISALFIMTFIESWNSYESTLLYMSDYPNLSYALYAIENRGTADYPAYMAGVLISLLPILVLFIAFQNTIMEKVHLGGLKG